jgi:hypothetical protein
VALTLLLGQSWYVPNEVLNPDYMNMDNPICQESTALFKIGSIQLLFCAVALNDSEPHRESNLKNYWFTAHCSLACVIHG